MERQFETKFEVGEKPLRSSPKVQLKIDCERYQEALNCEHLNEADRAAFLDALWGIITAFIDLGFGVSPVQLAKDSENIHTLCEREFSIPAKIAA